jgi:hypothetical protein
LVTTFAEVDTGSKEDEIEEHTTTKFDDKIVTFFPFPKLF